MNDAVSRMLVRYGCRKAKDDPRAMREILQRIALLGLWRGRLFEKAALCGGAALRLLHGLDRFEPDLDLTLLAPAPGFDFSGHGKALIREIRSLGFSVRMTPRASHKASPLASAFLKADTLQVDLEIAAVPEIPRPKFPEPPIRFRIEIDADPPSGLTVETRTCPLPIPFSVRTLALPDLLSLKLHALLCRRYYRLPKGRDWYDLAWFAARATEVNLAHLEARLRRSGQMPEEEPLTVEALPKMAARVIKILDVDEARREVAPFLNDAGPLAAWSPEFFQDAFCRIAAAGGQRP
jgi:hypothetical protein